MFVYRDCLLFLHRGPSWSANQMWTSLTVSITLVPQCWKVKASVLTAEKRPARPRRSPLPRLTPPPPCPLLLNMGQPRLEPSRAEQTRPLAGKNATLELFCLFIRKMPNLNYCSHLFSSSSCLTVGAEVSGRADSSLPVRSAHGFDTSAVPGSSRAAPLQAVMATTALCTLTPGPRETLESILVALDTEK